MDSVQLFPFVEYWWLYICFIGGTFSCLILDLGVFSRESREISMKEASIQSSIWIALALLFNFGLWRYSLWKFAIDPRLQAIPGFDPVAEAWRVALEFFAGYVVEKSLSVDNIFVFVIVFSYFGIPARYQRRVLFYGVIGAFVFRGLFIAMGSFLIQYQFVVLLLGAFLIFTGFRLMYAPDDRVEPEKNVLIKLFRKFVPVTTSLHGSRFFVRIDGLVHATPLFIALLFLEATDIVFAVDSVPAVFAITDEPLIVFTSNMAAILGLRSIYFLLSGAIDKFHLLKYGLAIILIFVGLKMVWLNQLYGGHFPINVSLGLILSVLLISVVASLIWPKNNVEKM